MRMEFSLEYPVRGDGGVVAPPDPLNIYDATFSHVVEF